MYTLVRFARGEVYVQRSGPRKAQRAWSGWYVQLGRQGGTQCALAVALA